MKTTTKYSPAVSERAVRLVLEHNGSLVQVGIRAELDQHGELKFSAR